MLEIVKENILKLANDSFSGSSFFRGNQIYQHNNIEIIDIDDNVIHAHVEGQSNKSYSTTIDIKDNEIISSCSCPVGNQCKHAAALALKYHHEYESLNPKNWLENFSESFSNNSSTNNKVEKDKHKCAFQLSLSANELSIKPQLHKLLKNGNFSSQYPKKIDSNSTLYETDLNDVEKKLVKLLDTYKNHYGEYSPIQYDKFSSLILDTLVNEDKESDLRIFFAPSNVAKKISHKSAKAIKVFFDKTKDPLKFKLKTNIKNDQWFHDKKNVYYLEKNSNNIYFGQLKLGVKNLDYKMMKLLMNSPKLSYEELSKLGMILSSYNADVELPTKTETINRDAVKPIPQLKLNFISRPLDFMDAVNDGSSRELISRLDYEYNYREEFPYLELNFKYPADGSNYQCIKHNSKEKIEFLDIQENKLVNQLRDHKSEIELSQELLENKYIEACSNIFTNEELENSFSKTFLKSFNDPSYFGISPINTYGEPNMKFKWYEFVHKEIPKLQESGWEIITSNNFPFKILDLDPEWNLNIKTDEGKKDSSNIDWFDLDLNAQTKSGKELDLWQIFIRILDQYESIDHCIYDIEENGAETLYLQIGREEILPIDRAKAIEALEFIDEAMDFGLINKFTGRPEKLSAYDLAFLIEKQKAHEASKFRFLGEEKLPNVISKLKEANEMINSKDYNYKISKKIKAELRDYQKFGLKWLDILKKQDFNGILADDMGLGKTLQSLSFIQGLKDRKELNKPCLVIAPTSLVFNWENEIKKFTPKLKSLVLHGKERSENFDKIEKVDIVITSYALIIRDKDTLLEKDFSYLILDEAQKIKNSNSKMYNIIMQLKADHRVSLTGTPLENNLNELWAQFNFLMPGLLGSKEQFRVKFKKPIEKEENKNVLKMLSHRISPFILRRDKSEVAKELPPKTEIVNHCEFSAEQRKFYNVIKAQMHHKLNQEIEAKGFERSQIMILDALLKLRQACCHPQIIKHEDAKKLKDSAKMEMLQDMLGELISENRKILLFSQFKSVFPTIEKFLNKEKIAYSKLTGDTIKRQEEIDNFQNGENKVFLISLKAGGTGLNLTAADTVIHYDPWWNPAVEDQASDRAYRIGQDKAVFVHKLIVKDSIEEKIIQLQEKKKALAKGVLSGDFQNFKKMTKEDLDYLFA